MRLILDLPDRLNRRAPERCRWTTLEERSLERLAERRRAFGPHRRASAGVSGTDPLATPPRA